MGCRMIHASPHSSVSMSTGKSLMFRIIIDREVERFWNIAIPHADGTGFYDPAHRSVVMAIRDLREREKRQALVGALTVDTTPGASAVRGSVNIRRGSVNTPKASEGRLWA